MKFTVRKEDLYEGIKIVERATSVKALQPVLMNIYIETLDKGAIRLVATDLDYTVVAEVDAQVEQEGKITLPSKMLNDIVSKLGDNLVSFEMAEGESVVHITCQKAVFDINGISANEFPQDFANIDLETQEGIEINLRTFVKAVKLAGFAAASLDTSNVLSGVVCNITEDYLEIASTDGNRLARYREAIENKDKKTAMLIVPSKIINEVMKMSSFIDEDTIKIYTKDTRIIFKSAKTLTISRLIDGMYPKYNELIPTSYEKVINVNVQKIISVIERVSVMVNEKTNVITLDLADNTMRLEASAPGAGKSEDVIDIDYTDDEYTIAFNFRYLLDVLKNMESENVSVNLNSPTSAVKFVPDNDEDYFCIVMPIQMRQ